MVSRLAPVVLDELPVVDELIDTTLTSALLRE
jgi:hypothetical protein